MAIDRDSIASVFQVFVDGKYEGTVNDFTFGRNRNLTSTALADGTIAVGVGVDHPTISFSRPKLKISKGRQVSIEILDGPVNFDVIYPGSDQQWQVQGFYRQNNTHGHQVDSGNATEQYTGLAKKIIRIK